MDRQAITDMARTIATSNGMSMTELAALVEQAADLSETVPTVAEFADRVAAVDQHKGSWSDHADHHRLLVDEHGAQRLDQARAADLETTAYTHHPVPDIVDEDEDHQGDTDSDGQLPYQQRRAFIRHARRFFDVAVDDRLIATNPADRVDLPVPAVSEFYERVRQVDGNKDGWRSRKGRMQLLRDELGKTRLDEVRPGDVEAVAVAQRQAVVAAEDERQDKLADRGLAGAPRRHGRGAERNLIEAARRLFTIAVDEKLIEESPAHKVKLPKRGKPTPRALKDHQLPELWTVVVSGGDDPELDGLMVWFHLETGARRGGAISVRIRDIKVDACVIVVYEKGRHGKKERKQPVSRELITALLAHATSRGPGRPGDPVFFYKDSTPRDPHPLTRKRYYTLVNRIRKNLPWARENWMKLHDLRRTGVTMIERISGSPAIARLFAGHSTGTPLDTYDCADDDELRAAMAEYLGRPVGEEAT